MHNKFFVNQLIETSAINKNKMNFINWVIFEKF